MQKEASKIIKDKIQTYQHIPAVVTPFGHAGAVAF